MLSLFGIGFSVSGQVNPHCRALPDFAIDSYMPLRLFNEPINLRESKPGALSGFFRRVKRLECLLDDTRD